MPTRIAPAAFAALVVLFLATANVSLAQADGTFDGKWRQGPLHEEYTVQQWLPTGCGPAPVSSTVGGGDVLSVHQDGDELTLAGGGRTFRTNQCYDQLPTLARDTHTRDASGRSWRTRCSTPAGDPRRATMNTLVVATSDTHIDVLETGRYEIQLAEGRCIADVRRSRSFDIVQRDVAAPAASAAPVAVPSVLPTPPPVATHRSACEEVGDPARLEVRPSRKLLRTGESFAFRASVVDVNGCGTGASTAWSVAPGAGTTVTVDSSGRVTAPTDAAEGSATLIASAAGRTVRVTVDVASPAHYDELLARSGLNASGENDSASTAETATGSIGGGDGRAEDGAKGRRTIFLVVVGGLAAVLGIIAVIFTRRTKRADQIEKNAEEAYDERVRDAAEKRAAKRAAHDAKVRAHEESLRRAQEAAREAREERARREADQQRSAAGGAATMLAPESVRAGGAGAVVPAGLPGMVCPTCRREYPPAAGFCSQDATKLVPINAGAPAASAPASGGSICPVCKRGFPPGTRKCPQDGEELVPYAMHAAVGKPGTGTIALTGKGKICPTCGGRFDGNAAFCGKDGTALVLIN